MHIVTSKHSDEKIPKLISEEFVINSHVLEAHPSQRGEVIKITGKLFRMKNTGVWIEGCLTRRSKKDRATGQRLRCAGS